MSKIQDTCKGFGRELLESEKPLVNAFNAKYGTKKELNMIKAKVVCDSISEQGNRLTTFEAEYPRIIHAELMTHRVFSRNAASSRAIPFSKMAEQLTGRPVRFGQANKGMQDKGEGFDATIPFCSVGSQRIYELSAEEMWDEAKKSALEFSEAFYKAGYHKQVYNRLTETFQVMKTIISATEWDNFYWLRNDGAADPTIAELARCMKEAHARSVPQLLKAGEWHLPYVDIVDNENGRKCYTIDLTRKLIHVKNDEFLEELSYTELSEEDAIKVSCARCASVSFRNVDYGVEKSREVYDRLVGDERKHASALEHCATPMQPYFSAFGKQPVNIWSNPLTWEDGISHMDRECNLWSGNYKGWIQHRKTIKGESK